MFPQVEDYTKQINEMKELFTKKSSDFDMIQDGMKTIKEFQKRKSQMEQELIDVSANKHSNKRLLLGAVDPLVRM